MADNILFSKRRPLSWFGPDDYDGGDWRVASRKRELDIAAWNAERLRRLGKLGLFSRWWFTNIATDTMP